MDPYLSPLMAEGGHLSGLPPSLIVLAQNDVLRDDGLMYYSRLKEAGVTVKLDLHKTMAHGFMTLSPLDFATFQGGRDGYNRIAQWLVEHL